MSIGSRLRQLRRANKLSGEKFGELCGVTKGTVSQWESDMITPGVDRLVELHKRLGFSLDWLLGGDAEDTAYTTTDPTMVAILRALEPRAEYLKENALQNVLNACKLEDAMRGDDTPGVLGHRLPRRTDRFDRAGDWIAGGPAHRAKKKNGDDE